MYQALLAQSGFTKAESACTGWVVVSWGAAWALIMVAQASAIDAARVLGVFIFSVFEM
jgi:hypothetical protein